MAKASSEKEQIDSDLLTEDEIAILNDQLDTKPSAAGYFALYRYATSSDMICIFISILACSAGGVGGPLMFVSRASSFNAKPCRPVADCISTGCCWIIDR